MPRTTKQGERKKILIVEDSSDFSDLLKFIVEEDGFEGIQFPIHSEDIIGAAKEAKPSVILMDLALRRKGGMDFINELKNDPATSPIPIVIISGRDLSHREVTDLQARGVRYLRKGRVEMHEIRREIRMASTVKQVSGAGDPA